MRLEYHLISTRLEQSNMVNRGCFQAKVNALREKDPHRPCLLRRQRHLPTWGKGLVDAVRSAKNSGCDRTKVHFKEKRPDRFYLGTSRELCRGNLSGLADRTQSLTIT